MPLRQAYKFDILEKTQEQKNSKFKEKTQGIDKMDSDKGRNEKNSAIKIPTFSINPWKFDKKNLHFPL